MFLCPATWRLPARSTTEGTGASSRESLSFQLAAGTRDVHEASDSLIRRKAPLAFSSKRVWAALLSQFYYVFRSLEAALESASSRDARVRRFHAPFFVQLARSDAFLADVRHSSPLLVAGCALSSLLFSRLPSFAVSLPRRCRKRTTTSRVSTL